MVRESGADGEVSKGRLLIPGNTILMDIPFHYRLHEALTDQCDAVRESAEQAKQNAENSKQEIKMMLEYSKVVMNKISKSLICDVQLQDDIIH